MALIRLIVGLGNPGVQYSKTRHNAGFWFVDGLVCQHQVTLRSQSKFHGMTGAIEHEGRSILLLQPQDFMNRSGFAVAAMSSYSKLAPDEVLVVHDELDFAPGVIRPKFSGGHGGHNGLRDIIQRLGTNDFLRLRIGIGHPGDRNKVVDYVLNRPSEPECQAINQAISRALAPETLRFLLAGDVSRSASALLVQS